MKAASGDRLEAEPPASPAGEGAWNQGYEYTDQLDARARGCTVLAYLVSRYRHSTEEVWRARIDAGEVRVGGAIAEPQQQLAAGQVLSWRRPPWPEPEAPLHYSVIFEDEDLLVVAKPSGLATVPGGGFLAHTLLSLVQRRDAAWDPMHRLGRGTSGLVVFARTAPARSLMQRAWRSGLVEKTYRALASGALPEHPLEIEAPIGRVEHPVLGGIHAFSESGRPAHTLVRRLELRGEASLAEVRIATGRPHQIRIHLAYAGHPLVGDPLYGPGGVPRPGTRALPGDLGYQLHAWRLRFEHPRTREMLELEAPVPPALATEGEAKDP